MKLRTLTSPSPLTLAEYRRLAASMLRASRDWRRLGDAPRAAHAHGEYLRLSAIVSERERLCQQFAGLQATHRTLCTIPGEVE